MLRNKIDELVINNHFECDIHGNLMFKKISNLIIKMYLYRWMKEVNLILKGTMTYPDNGADFIKRKAQLYDQKTQKKKSAIGNIKKLAV